MEKMIWFTDIESRRMGYKYIYERKGETKESKIYWTEYFE